MNYLTRYLHELSSTTMRAWDRFWFTPADPSTLGLIRLLAGCMMLYTHAVWTLELDAFFGPHSWLNREAVTALDPQAFTGSYLWWCESPAVLWTVHGMGFVVFAMFAVGYYSRITAVLAWFITINYAHRVPLALFGLDQINGFLAMYLMLGPCGATFSVDRLLAQRKPGQNRRVAPSIAANVSVRLIQLQLCILYFFAGISKLQGPSWWDGTAFWGAVANLEYQSMDFTWLVHWPLLINLMTHTTIFWEIAYCALVWPRLTRPLILAMAIPLHLGIGLGLGMMTFGTIMLVANLAFVPPSLIRALCGIEGEGSSESNRFAHGIRTPHIVRNRNRVRG